jgi:hypothetical protein
MPNGEKKKTKKSKDKKVQNRDFSAAQEKALKPITEKGEKKWVTMEKRSLEDAIDFGHILVDAKKVIFGDDIKKEGEGDEKKKGAWGRYRTKHYPGLKDKTAQRYMLLAPNVDLEKHPNLAYLGQTNLLRLIQLGKGKKPAKVLVAGGVNIKFASKDADARKKFQSKSAALISKLAAAQRKLKEDTKSPQKQPTKPSDLNLVGRLTDEMIEAIGSLPYGKEFDTKFRPMLFKLHKLKGLIIGLLMPVKDEDKAA